MRLYKAFKDGIADDGTTDQLDVDPMTGLPISDPNSTDYASYTAPDGMIVNPIYGLGGEFANAFTNEQLQTLDTERTFHAFMAQAQGIDVATMLHGYGETEMQPVYINKDGSVPMLIASPVPVTEPFYVPPPVSDTHDVPADPAQQFDPSENAVVVHVHDHLPHDVLLA